MEIGMTKKKNKNNSSMICIDISIISNSSIYKRLSLKTKELKKKYCSFCGSNTVPPDFRFEILQSDALPDELKLQIHKVVNICLFYYPFYFFEDFVY